MAFGYSEKNREQVERNLAKTTFPKLVTVKSKHATDHYLATDRDTLLDISFFVFGINHESGYYDAYGEADASVEEHIKNKRCLYRDDSGRMADVTVELYTQWKAALESHSLDGLKDIHDLIRKRVKEVDLSYEDWTRSGKMAEFCDKILADEDKLAAYLILLNRKDSEYEGFDVSNFDSIS